MSLSATPRLSAVVVLATPPFWLASANTRAVRDIGCASAGWQDPGVRTSPLTIGVLSAGTPGTRVRRAPVAGGRTPGGVGPAPRGCPLGRGQLETPLTGPGRRLRASLEAELA